MVLVTFGLCSLKVVLLRNIYTVVEQLSQILSQAEAAKLLSSLIDSLPKEPHPLIATARMQLVLTTVRGPLFTESSAARAILLATICRQLRLHLSQPLVTSFCTETLGHMMNFYRNMSMADDTTEDNVWYRDVETIALATLAVLIQAVQSAQKTDSNVVAALERFEKMALPFSPWLFLFFISIARAHWSLACSACWNCLIRAITIASGLNYRSASRSRIFCCNFSLCCGRWPVKASTSSRSNGRPCIALSTGSCFQPWIR